MNHIYRVVWNNITACWQVVAESARAHGKTRSVKRNPSLRPLALALGVASGLSPVAWAGPTGGQVTAGSATIQQSGATTTINQSSQNAAINWQAFSVGQNEAVRFNQPNASAITLNRVTGTESSQILGSLAANGQVFILNPNGVLFGNGAQVNVGGIIASTGRISDADFMAGNYKITGANAGSVVNEGNIHVAEGGVLALIAPVVTNTGTLSAPQGSVLLAGAEAVTLQLQDGSLVGYTLDKGSLQAMVDNGGLIQAEGGHVILTAKGLDALSKATVNHSGIIEAQTVSNRNGVIELLGDMEIGQVNVSGKIDASAPNGGDGGFVETSALKVRIDNRARVTTAAPNGKFGTWLIDPNDFAIKPSGGDMTGAFLSTSLASGNVSIQTATMGSPGRNGDIFVNDAVSWNSPTVLSLIAERNMHISRAITGSHANSGVTLYWGVGSPTSSLLFAAPVSVPRISLILNNGATASQEWSGPLTTDMLVAMGNGAVDLGWADNSIGAVKADIGRHFWIVNGARPLTVASAPYGVSGVTAANIGLITGGDLILNAPLTATDTTDLIGGSERTTDALCTGSCVHPHVQMEAGRFVNNVGASAIAVQPGKFWALIAESPSTTTLNGLNPDAISYDGNSIRGMILLSSNRVFYRERDGSTPRILSVYVPLPEDAGVLIAGAKYDANSGSAPNNDAASHPKEQIYSQDQIDSMTDEALSQILAICRESRNYQPVPHERVVFYNSLKESALSIYSNKLNDLASFNIKNVFGSKRALDKLAGAVATGALNVATGWIPTAGFSSRVSGKIFFALNILGDSDKVMRLLDLTGTAIDGDTAGIIRNILFGTIELSGLDSKTLLKITEGLYKIGEVGVETGLISSDSLLQISGVVADVAGELTPPGAGKVALKGYASIVEAWSVGNEVASEAQQLYDASDKVIYAEYEGRLTRIRRMQLEEELKLNNYL